jgi:AcrR family transcriptional regulator
VVSHYFLDKRDLLLATFRSRADVAHTCATALIAAGASPLEAFVEAVLPLDAERLLNWQVWLAFWGTAIGDDELSAAQRERHEQFHADLVRALAVERREGRVAKNRDLGHEARRIITVLDGLAVQVVFEPPSWPPAEQRRIVDEHLHTLRPGASTTPRSRSHTTRPEGRARP